MGKEIGHIELTSKDLITTKKFYSKLFGWKFEMFGDGYAMFKTSQKGVGGGMGYWGTIGDPHGNVIGLWSKK